MPDPQPKLYLWPGASKVGSVSSRSLSTSIRVVGPGAGALRRAVELSPEALVFTLDQALFNTSVVCLFSYRGRSVLFPGDAQFGNWKAWLDGKLLDALERQTNHQVIRTDTLRLPGAPLGPELAQLPQGFSRAGSGSTTGYPSDGRGRRASQSSSSQTTPSGRRRR
jgi:hypothetical protein